jgi:hypothetical protein
VIRSYGKPRNRRLTDVVAAGDVAECFAHSRHPDAAASALIRCTTRLPVPNSRATFKMPLPLASAARMAASLAGYPPSIVPLEARRQQFPAVGPAQQGPITEE